MDDSSQQVFRSGGIVTINDFLSRQAATELVQKVLMVVDANGIKRDGYPRHGGRALHEILDGLVVQEQFPGLMDLYSEVRAIAEGIVEKTVILSPYPRSGVNIRVYRQPESEDGWHYDSNPLSALLYLTDGGQPTQFKMPTGGLCDIFPTAGLLLLFDGRSLLHRVPKGDHLRVTCPFNLYYPDDVARPDYVDRVLFENHDKPRSAIGNR